MARMVVSPGAGLSIALQMFDPAVSQMQEIRLHNLWKSVTGFAVSTGRERKKKRIYFYFYVSLF